VTQTKTIHTAGTAAGRTLGLVLLAAVAASGGARAQGLGADGPNYLTLGGGGFNVTDPGGEPTADFRLEYRHGESFLWLKPWAGLELTGDGGAWGGGGVAFDTVLGEHVVLTISTGVGAYGEGSGKDLGHTVEFRSQFEVGYQFADETRLSAAFGHLSNAGIGDANPGAETATLYYHVPLSRLGALLD
jgi:hypothetical protein